MSYSNNFSFDTINLCRVLNLTPHPDLIKMYFLFLLLLKNIENLMKK